MSNKFRQIGFHRTHNLEAMMNIAVHGYKIPQNKSTKLGANGLNLFLDWHSVIDPQNIKSYGPFLLKYGIDPTDCLVLDMDKCKSYFGHTSLERQLDFLGIKPNPDLDLDQYQARLHDGGPQNVLAVMAQHYIVNYANNSKRVAGLILRTTANQPFAVIYNLQAVELLGFAKDTKEATIAGQPLLGIPEGTSEQQVNWNKFRAGH